MADKTTDAAPVALPSLPVKKITVFPEVNAKTPGNESTDIVEIELYPPNDGNFAAWFHWMDCVRFRVQRGYADKALAAMGLKR